MSRLLNKLSSPSEHRIFARVAEQAARAGGRILREMLGKAQVFEKGPRDVVTEADHRSQHVIRNILLTAFPDHQFLGEEDEDPLKEHRPDLYRWIVDPLDGTANYVHALPGFAVSVAVECGGEVLAGVVYDPIADECFTAQRGGGAYLNGKRLEVSQARTLAASMVAASFTANVTRDSAEIARFVEMLTVCHSLRRMGSAALNMSYLAAGRIDAYWATSVKAWDVAAGVLLVTEAGGTLAAVDGSPFRLSEPNLSAAATGELHRELVVTLSQAVRV